jgi:hypothetical protein
LNAPVSKTGWPARVTGVRISPSPLTFSYCTALRPPLFPLFLLQVTAVGVPVGDMKSATPSKKRGPKPKPFFYAKEGQYINGLRKRPVDGRWELSDGRMFTEPDEDRAVARFREMSANDGAGLSKAELAEKARLAQVVNWAWLAEQIRQRPLTDCSLYAQRLPWLSVS